MKTLIDRDELYKALAQWDWQDLYLPVHFKELVDELPVQRSYEDGVRKGYEDAVRHYAKMALKQWIPVSEGLPKEKGIYPVWTAKGFGDHLSTSYWDGNGWSLRVVAWMPKPEPYKEGEK